MRFVNKLTAWLRDAAQAVQRDDREDPPRAPLAPVLMDGILVVLEEAYYSGISIQSDFARRHAVEVGAASSLGLITTEEPEGYGRVWRPTVAGTAWLLEP